MNNIGSKTIIYLIGGSPLLASRVKEHLEIEVLLVPENTAEKYFIEIFEKIKNYIESKIATNIIILYKNDDYHNYGFISGLLKTVQQENPKITGKTIGVDSLTLEKITFLTQIIEKEIYTLETEIRYHGNKREVKIYHKIGPVKKSSSIIKQGGVYLITGGAGEIGLIFARYISNTKNTQIVLTGRRLLTQEKKTVISQIPNTKYLQVDISDKDAVENLINSIKSEYKVINGIIHSAGYIRDSFIQNKSHQEIYDVLSPKLKGVKNLDQATKMENLDFMVFFSSVAGVMGNIGQSDYASANAYLDNYAQYRTMLRQDGKRKGKTLSINWSLWEQGGMQLNIDGRKHIKKQFGLNTLSTEDGIKAFEELLSTDTSQGIVTFGKEKEIYARFIQTKEIEHKNTEIKALSESEQSNQKDFSKLKYSVVQKLIEMASVLLKLEPNVIKLDKDLGEYGFGSILLTRFSNELSNFYDLDLIPTIFYNFPTINDLSNHLINEYENALYNKHKISEDREIITEPKELENNLLPKKRTKKTLLQPHKDFKAFYKDSSVAIIGISGRLPGSSSLDEFWEHIRDNKDLITEIPPDRWDWKKYYGDPQTSSTKTKAKWGGFIKDIDKFDSLYFNISPREAQLMDPQQRITLETVFSALEDAGVDSNKIKGSNTGIFIGVASSDYSVLLDRNSFSTEAQFTTGGAHSILANRISYLLDIHGPSEPIDTACSSSLIAIHRAVENIRHGTCKIAIAGGVNAIITPDITLSFSQAGMLSEDGRCKTFDQSANGYVRGEGVGIVILKSLREAEADGDHIYAIIRASSENHGGKANTLTSPNPIAQKELLVKAYQDAHIDPREVSYIEAHGTGTPLGDPIEIEGLKLAFSELYKAQGLAKAEVAHCGIGSVKTNIGHLEAAAGMAGIFKIIYAMKHKTLPGNPNLKQVNAYLKLDNTPFYLLKDTIAWESVADKPRVAGISSFGFGGANAHVIIEEYQPKPAESFMYEAPAIIVLSAKDKDRLNEQVLRLKKHIEAHASVGLYDIAYTLQEGRNSMEERLALIASSKEEVIEKLGHYLEGKTDGVFYGNIKQEKSDFLLEGGAGKAYIRYAIDNKESQSLAQLWVKGIEIDWKLLYSPAQPHKVSLPTYPFLKERHWIKEKKIVNPPINNSLIEKDESLKNIKESQIREEFETDTIEIVRNIFSDRLQIDKNKLLNHIDFENLGLDSILIHSVLQELKKYGYNIPANIIWEYNNIERLSEYISTNYLSEKEQETNTYTSKINDKKNEKVYSALPLHIEVLKEGEHENPIFIIPGAPGVSSPYSELAKYINDKSIVYGLNWKGVLEGEEPFKTMEEIVHHNIKIIDMISTQGPIHLISHSYGALIVYEMLKYYSNKNREVKNILLIDSNPYILNTKLKEKEKLELFLKSILFDKDAEEDIAWICSKVLKQRANKRLDYMLAVLNEKGMINSIHNNLLKRLYTTFHSAITVRHVFERIKLPYTVTVIKAKNDNIIKDTSIDQSWNDYFSEVKTNIFNGNHFSLVKKPNAKWIENVIWQ